MKNVYCVMMAGGIGSRFWPMSRETMPKQFIDPLGVGKTMLQQTYERFLPLVKPEHFLVVTGEQYRDMVLQQLPQLTYNQVLTEPMRRNTAPCLAYAAYRLKQMDPEAIMIMTPSDHLILNQQEFERVLRLEVAYAEQHDALLTIGIKPTFPATGYGYIEVENPSQEISNVRSFKEKPNYEKAASFLKNGGFAWNSGMFVWSVDSIVKSIEKHLPDIALLFSSISEYYGTQEEQEHVNEVYKQSRSISIDYGILEHATNVKVSCSNPGWSDLGTWDSLYRESEKDDSENVVHGNHILLENSERCLVKQLNSNKLIVVNRVQDLLVVDTENVLYITPLGNEEEAKHLTENVLKSYPNLK